MKLNFNTIISSLVIIIISLIIFLVDAKSELEFIKQEITDLRSEDKIFKNNHPDDVLFENIESNEIIPEKNIDVYTEPKIEDKKTENKLFFTLNPIVNIEIIREKYFIEKAKKNSNQKISIVEKKSRFIKIILPAIKESRNKLLATYKNLKNMKGSNLTIQDEEYLALLYKNYRVKYGDFEKLLLAVKPHPVSLILAQATLESGWGTSRFFREANNIFGIWSFSEDDERIRARTTENIYLKKYDSFVEAVDDYMIMLGKNERYRDFRKSRSKTENPFLIMKHLEMYSELRKEYVKRLRLVIKANSFRKYDVESKEVKE